MENENLVKIRLWYKSDSKSLGHISLETFSNDSLPVNSKKYKSGPGIYVSFWPKDVCEPDKCSNHNISHFHRLEKDNQVYGHGAEDPLYGNYHELTCLKVKEIHRKFLQIEQHPCEWRYVPGIYKLKNLFFSYSNSISNYNCSSLVNELLRVGDLKNEFQIIDNSTKKTISFGVIASGGTWLFLSFFNHISRFKSSNFGETKTNILLGLFSYYGILKFLQGTRQLTVVTPDDVYDASCVIKNGKGSV